MLRATRMHWYQSAIAATLTELLLMRRDIAHANFLTRMACYMLRAVLVIRHREYHHVS